MINPPYPVKDFPSPPLGLMSLGAYLKGRGYDVIIDDLVVNTLTHERVKRISDEFDPGFIGISGATMNIKKALEVLSLYRERVPGSVTLAGGPHATFDAEDLLRENPHLDFVVRGEGELTTAELLDAVMDGDDYPGIDGLSYREGESVVHNRKREFISDINSLPLPDLSLAELGKYRALGLPVNMTTSRGCPYSCVFCVGNKMVGNRVRFFETMRVVDEFQALAQTGAKQINIADDLFTSNRRRCMEICREIIRRGIKQEWTAFARVDTVSEELLSLMRRAGCTTLCFGIESGNQEILDRVKKKTDLKTCREAMDICRRTGIRPMTAYILGLPGETHETVRKTLEFSRSLSDTYGYHILAPFPGSEVREKAEEYGIRIVNRDWNLYDAKHAVSETTGLKASEIEKVLGDFQEGINNYVRGIEKRMERGDDLPPGEMEIFRNRRSREFASQLIFSGLIEAFNKKIHSPGKDAVESLVDHLASKVSLKRETVIDEVERLIKNNCIDISGDLDGEVISWC